MTGAAADDVTETTPVDRVRDAWTGPRWLLRFLLWFFRHLYTTWAWSYDFVAWATSLGAWDSWRNTSLESLGPDDPVLEVGCGTGHLIRRLLDGGRRAWAVDVSRQMTRIAAARLRRGGRLPSVARAMAQALPYRSGAFASAVATFPSDYLLDPRSLVEIHRVLRPGGRLVVVVSARIRPRRLWHRAARWLFDATGQAPSLDRRWTEPVQSAGFATTQRIVETGDAEVLQIIARAEDRGARAHATIRRDG